jgi:hypothetical protein
VSPSSSSHGRPGEARRSEEKRKKVIEQKLHPTEHIQSTLKTKAKMGKRAKRKDVKRSKVQSRQKKRR